MADCSRAKAVLSYFAVVFLSTIISIAVLDLWNSDLTVPFQYTGDAWYHLGVAKGLLDNGWILHNTFVGMPGSQSLAVDFPSILVEIVPWLLLKLIGAFTHSAPMAVNIYFLSQFPLIALCSMICFRQMGIDYGSSLVGSLLYAFLPYHLLRAEEHLVMNSYYVVPLAVLIMLWIYRDQVLLFEITDDSKPRMRLNSYRHVVSIAICIIIAVTYEYYAFFTCFFLLVVGILSSIRRRNLSHLLTALFLIAIMSVSFLAALSPAILHSYKNGRNVEVAARSPREAEAHGLKISQMLLPVTGHRVEALKEAKQSYKGTPRTDAADFGTLGVIGSVGFLSLILWPLLRRNFNNSDENSSASIVDLLSIMTIYAVLLATIGGFSSLFAFTVSPMLRCYDRMSVYIAFFSLASVLLLLTYLYRKYSGSWKTGTIWVISLLMLLVVGLLDEIPQDVSRSFHQAEAEYASDAEFVSQIEASLPAGSMIFQLPYFSFPESGPDHQEATMDPYEQSRGYLHSKSLRWSYGAVRGRWADLWQKRHIVAKPTIVEGVENLAVAGFAGIYVDRFGYPDRGAEIEKKLTKLLDSQPMESPNKRLLFFDLRAYSRRAEVAYSAYEWHRKKSLLQQNVVSLPLGRTVSFAKNGTGLGLTDKGFSVPTTGGLWTSSQEAILRFVAPPTTGDLEMTLHAIPFEQASWQRRRYVDVFCDENHVARWPLLPDGQNSLPFKYQACIKKSLLKPDQMQQISFRFNEPISPRMLGMSEDSRLLGLAFVSMDFTEVAQTD